MNKSPKDSQANHANNPLVSVIMPCYNDGLYIEEAVNALRVQTYQPIELIVVDDGSTDKMTRAVLEQLKFPKL